VGAGPLSNQPLVILAADDDDDDDDDDDEEDEEGKLLLDSMRQITAAKRQDPSP